MNSVLKLGKYLLAVIVLVFGVMHLMNSSGMAGMAPFGGAAMVIVAGIGLILAAVAIFIGKYDKLACVLLAVELLLFAFLIHLPGLMNAADEMSKAVSMGSFLKDIGLAGGALMAAQLAKDNSVIG